MPNLVHKISSNSDSDTDSNSTDDEGMPVPARASRKEEGAKRFSREDAYANAAPEGGSRTDTDSNDRKEGSDGGCSAPTVVEMAKECLVRSFLMCTLP